MPPSIDTVRSWQGATMVGPDGDKVGTIESIYVDDQSGEPEWALVHTGLFGTKSTFVPLAQATSTGDQIQVPYQKQLVNDAPRIDPDQHLSESEEQQLWRHYGLDYATTSGYEDGTATASTTRCRTPPWAATPTGPPPTTTATASAATSPGRPPTTP